MQSGRDRPKSRRTTKAPSAAIRCFRAFTLSEGRLCGDICSQRPCGYGNGWTVARYYQSQKQTAHRSEPFVVARGVI